MHLPATYRSLGLALDARHNGSPRLLLHRPLTRSEALHMPAQAVADALHEGRFSLWKRFILYLRLRGAHGVFPYAEEALFAVSGRGSSVSASMGTKFSYHEALHRAPQAATRFLVHRDTPMPQSPTGRPTLEDVARLADVSLGSASRALSNPGLVKPKTLKRVMQAVAQLGYVRNGAARALASRRTFSVGAVYPTLHNPAFADSIHSLQQTLWSFGYQLVVASHEYVEERECEVVRSIVERGVDGLILVGVEHDQELFDLMRHRKLPLVLIWSLDRPPYGQTVGFSNRQAAYDLTRAVLAKGHKDIAVVCGSREHNERARQRVGGTMDAMAEQGLRLREDWIIEQPLSVEGGKLAMRRILEMGQRPTALMCNTDTLAIGALHECRVHGIAVPDELSITGYDDIALASLTVPPLTTVHIPAVQMGTLAARRLVGLIENRDLGEVPALSHEVVIRESLSQVPSLHRSRIAVKNN